MVALAIYFSNRKVLFLDKWTEIRALWKKMLVWIRNSIWKQNNNNNNMNESKRAMETISESRRHHQAPLFARKFTWIYIYSIHIHTSTRLWTHYELIHDHRYAVYTRSHTCIHFDKILEFDRCLSTLSARKFSSNCTLVESGRFFNRFY